MLTNVSVAYMYKEPTYGCEGTSQSLLGEEVEILEEKAHWRRIKQHDAYTGWISKYFLTEKPRDWDKYPKFTPKAQIAWIYQSPDLQSSTIRDMTFLSAIPVVKHADGWVNVLLPDGQTGWMVNDPAFHSRDQDVEQIMETAFKFLGIQYFWGGRSPKGFDCSGFVQTVFALNGMQLPRDAYMQAELGEPVDNDFSQWSPGDLLFFSETPDRVTHVAISLGDGDFIHASGYVRINSMNPEHKDIYIERYATIFTKTMRVL